LTATSAAIFVSGLIYFWLLQRGGEVLITMNDKIEQQSALVEHKEPDDAEKVDRLLIDHCEVA
jgi:hypothetical protein